VPMAVNSPAGGGDGGPLFAVSWTGGGARWRSSPPPARPAHTPAPAAFTSVRGATDTTPRCAAFQLPGSRSWLCRGAGSQERCRELPATSSSESSCSSSGGVKEAAMDWSTAIAVWSCSRTGSTWGLGGRRRWSP
jgi:hypothetical protein